MKKFLSLVLATTLPLSAFAGLGAGTEVMTRVQVSPGAELETVAGDFDGDGLMDTLVAIAVGGEGGVQLKLLRNAGPGQDPVEEALGQFSYLRAPISLSAADFDGDGDLDFVLGAVDYRLGQPIPQVRGYSREVAERYRPRAVVLHFRNQGGLRFD